MQCGISLPPTATRPTEVDSFSAQNSSSSSRTSDGIILVGILIWASISLFEFIIQSAVDDWYKPPLQYLFIGLNFISALVPLLISFAINNKTLKAIAIIAASLFLLRALYGNIKWALDML